MQYLSHPVEEQGRHHHSDDHMLHITYVHRLQPSLVRIDAAKLKSRNNLLSKLALSVPTTVSGLERCTGRQWSLFFPAYLYTSVPFDQQRSNSMVTHVEERLVRSGSATPLSQLSRRVPSASNFLKSAVLTPLRLT